MRTTVDDPNEIELASLIGRRLQQGRFVRSQFEESARRGVGAGSELEGDDAATSLMNLSHVVRNALMMATDNIRALDGLLRPSGTLVVPPYAHYPIIRSVLEASALAKWILQPDARRQRVERLLLAQISDIRQDSALAKVELSAVENLDEPPPPSVLQQQRNINEKRRSRDMAMVEKIASDHDIAGEVLKQGLPPWSAIIRAVCTVPAGMHGIRVPGEYAEGIWKIASGLSHPSLSRTTRHSDLDEQARPAPGMVSVQVTASLRVTHDALLIACNTAREAVELFDQRSAPQIPAAFRRDR